MVARIRNIAYLKHISACISGILPNQRKKIQCACVRGAAIHKMAEKSLPSSTTDMVGDMGDLHSKFGWMTDKTRCFGVNGNHIEILSEPSEFYDNLKTLALSAKSRIILASLYLGTGSLEKELVSSIEEACKEARKNGNDDFEVHILLDYNRGSRGKEESSRTMLLNLVKNYKQYVHVHLYHTPDLRGWLKKVVPERFDETVGLTHMKIYLADDSFIISGANLSETYFTNRQDRYIQFNRCSELSDYFSDLVKTVASFSFTLNPDNTTQLPDDWTHHPYEGEDDGTAFKLAARRKLLNNMSSKPSESYSRSKTRKQQNVTQSKEEKTADRCDDDGCHVDTWVCPLLQMGPFGVSVDEEVTSSVMRRAEEGDRILLASGYFNLTDQYMEVILNRSKGIYKILTASPQANGFYGGRGVAGHVPETYTHILKQFYNQVCSLREEGRICIWEYFRQDWTFHGKGLWYYLQGETLPVMTFVGSPNFGYRSVFKDLECQAAIVTTNKSLRKKLREEHEKMYELSTPVSGRTFEQADRQVPLWVKLVTVMTKKFF